MRTLSEREIRVLGEAFGIPVPDGEIDSLVEQTNDNLDGLDAVYGVHVDAGADYGERSWRAGDDEHNAIVTACEVQPTGSGPLDGFSIGVKDIIAVAGVPMECGSGAMQGFIPGFDAAVIERLLGAGATIAAKTNLDEFAGGGRGISFDGRISNPHDPERTAGGSSGGSAVAVATGIVDAALGTDTGGSVRHPASRCGIVGMKPTYGLVPLHGVVENTYTLDHVGPMTRTVEDAARLLEVLAGKDRRDPASMGAAGRDDYRVGGYVEAVETHSDPAELAIGLVEEGIGRGVAEDPVDDAVIDRTEAAVDALEDAGANVERISIDCYEDASPVKDATSYVELATHWRAGGAAYRRDSLVDEAYHQALARRTAAAGEEVDAYYRARLLAGAHLVADLDGRYYTRARAAREVLKAAFDDALDGVDALLTPTKPNVTPRFGEDPGPGWSTSRDTRPANVTGLPAISLPNGDVDGLPVGLQLIGAQFEDAALLGSAAAVEAVL